MKSSPWFLSLSERNPFQPINHWTGWQRFANKLAMLSAAILFALAVSPPDISAQPISWLQHSPKQVILAKEWCGAARPAKRNGGATVKLAPPTPWLETPEIEGPANSDLPLVVIDAGHGGHDPGAISPHNGKQEKHITLAIAQAIRRELLATGRVRVALTRNNDRYLALEQRSSIARRLKADLFLSIHADAAENPEARGASIYTLSQIASDKAAARLAARENQADILNGVDLGAHGSAVSSILLDLTQRQTMGQASEFARLLQREAADDMVFRTKAHRFADFAVLKAPDTPSILFETGYISNKADAYFLSSDAGPPQIARGVRDAVRIYFARRQAGR